MEIDRSLTRGVRSLEKWYLGDDLVSILVLDKNNATRLRRDVKRLTKITAEFTCDWDAELSALVENEALVLV
jgi:hypothetical protein